MKTAIWVSTTFPAYHAWLAAPESTAFLRSYHRHLFHVKLTVEVEHNDREVEFFDLLTQLDTFITKNYRERSMTKSCEEIAGELVVHFHALSVEVSEDGENGAIVYGSIATALRKKCFVGREVEGPNRGALVLFVPGSVTPSRFEEVARREVELIDRIYFGAGNDRDLNPLTLQTILAVAENNHLQCDIEIDFDDWSTKHKGLSDTVASGLYDTTVIGYCGTTPVPPYDHEPGITYWKWIDVIRKTITWQENRRPGETVAAYVSDLNDDRFTDDETME